MTVNGVVGEAERPCSTHAQRRGVSRREPNSVSASSGLGSFMYAMTRLPSSFGTTAEKTRKSGIVLTWITA